MKKLLAMLLCVVMVVTLLPTMAVEAGEDQYLAYDAGTFSPTAIPDGATSVVSDTTSWTAGWYVVTGEVTINDLIETTGEVHLVLKNGCTLTANKGIYIKNSDGSLSIYAQSEDATMGKLITTGSGTYAGITVGEGRSLFIQGGYIDAKGNNENYIASPGIGGGSWDGGTKAGRITINGGHVVAKKSVDYNSVSAAIGGGSCNTAYDVNSRSGGFQSITITGGTVEADGFIGTAQMGTAQGHYPGSIVISGGVVSAERIGGNSIDYKGTFSTGTNGNAIIYCSQIMDNDDTTAWYAIIFNGNIGTVYGDVALTEDFTIPAGATLTVPDGAALTIPAGVELTNNGTINIAGTLTNHGEVDDYGIVNGVVGGTPVTQHHMHPDADGNPSLVTDLPTTLTTLTTLAPGVYTLTGPTVLASDVALTGSVTLCLNGYTLYLNDRVLTVTGTLTICDCQSTGMVTGGGHIAVTGGELALTGGSVTGLTGGVKLSAGGKLTVSGGRLYNSTR